PPDLYTRLHEVAEELDRPDARLLALFYSERHHLSPAGRRERVAAFDVLLPHVPADTPFGYDYLYWLRDAYVGVLLQYIEPVTAAEAVERCYLSPVADATAPSNVALMRMWAGQWEKVLELTSPIIAAGVTRQETKYRHIAVCAAARTMVQLERPEEALSVLELWVPEITRRGWHAPLELNTCCRAYALHALARPAEAAELFAALPRPFAYPPTRVMALRVERLAGLGSDPAAAAELAADWYDARWNLTPHYLAALVEQALREPSVDTRRDLLAHIDEHPTPLVLTYGYQADLDKLRAELSS
ncbi:MAG TPA: hypothetical protein VNA30_04610, partial [Mycobacteriales bacterium]|nr:hypothetical protein [Mycobacteriales bacterium]